MEMHSRQSLYEIHGMSIERRRPRSRLLGRLIARIVAFMTKVKRTIEAELKIRRAMAELAKMDDHMLRDLGIHRGEIEDRLRAQRADAGTNNASVFSKTTANSHPDLPTVNSPLIVSEGRPAQDRANCNRYGSSCKKQASGLRETPRTAHFHGMAIFAQRASARASAVDSLAADCSRPSD